MAKQAVIDDPEAMVNNTEATEEQATPKLEDAFDYDIDDNDEAALPTEDEIKKAAEKLGGEIKDTGKTKDTDIADADDYSRASETDTGGKAADDTGTTDDSPKLSADLVAKAKELGFNESDIEAFGDDGRLTRAIGIVATRLAAAESAAKTATETAEAETTETAAKFELSADLADLYGPELVDAFNGLCDHFQGLVDGLQGQVEGLQATADGQEQREFQTFFDGAVEDLGADYADVFGKGSVDKLDETSEHYQNRQSLMDQMDVIESGRVAAGLRPLSPAKLFDQALNSVFSDNINKNARKNIADKLKGRKKLNSQRPTNRKTAAIGNPEQAAIDAAREGLKKMGLDEETSDPYDTLPG